ncbi:MAG: CvpA family protein [Fibrobacter sp.]|nr:CvpA family protein [Fibrobacter sp.]
MNTLDLVSLILILVLSILGIWNGFLRGIFRLMAWIAGIVGAYNANNILSHFFRETMGFSEFSTTLVCYAVGFLVPFLILLFIGHMLQKSISDTSFGTLDRVLGGIFGFIKGSLIWFALFSILHIMPFGESLLATRDASFSYRAYRSTLEIMGFSSEPIDLVDVAEKKASDIVEKATDKATEAAKEVVKDAAKDAAKATVDETRKSVQEKAANPAKN